ncbi:MAG: hypothetical protein OXE96_03320 [Gemmatimonadetes bacterium]|nr:hypothetical protein [Gemmatimonadota bacterium]
MITRHKWQVKDDLASDEIPADAITADLRTANNTLSFWQCGQATESEVSDAVLALAAGRDRIQKLDIVWILTDELESDGQSIRLTRGKTPVVGLSERHVDVCHLDYRRLGRIGDRVATAIRQDQWKRFRKREIVTLLIAAMRSGRLSETGLTEKVQKEIRAAL